MIANEICQKGSGISVRMEFERYRLSKTQSGIKKPGGGFLND